MTVEMLESSGIKTKFSAQDNGGLQLASKAETLAQLIPVLQTARVLPLVRFPASKFLIDPKPILKQIGTELPAEKLIIRSSSRHEDGLTASLAGHFTSVLNVTAKSDTELCSAIESVIESFGDELDGGCEVLVQPMLAGVSRCGVVITADLYTGAPYYVVNFDDGGLTDTITSGSARRSNTYVQFRNSPVPCQDPQLARLLETCKELESLFSNEALDVEFAFTVDGALYILQVRPLVCPQDCSPDNALTGEIAEALEKLQRKLAKLCRPNPLLLGKTAIFGVMPDWNPAEMIGIRPKPLALSLYKELITDNIWAYQRDNYGYRNMRSHPLLLSFLGFPFIDVRVDFNSFVPKAIDDALAEKLVDCYLEKLDRSPGSHDKVEFDIVFSCYYLGLPAKLQTLKDDGFSQEELIDLEQALLQLTNQMLHRQNGLFGKDLLQISVLESRYSKITESELSILEKIYWLIEDCKRYGTLPFAGIARAAFVAMQMLQSLVSAGLLDSDEYHQFLSSLNTISKQLSKDTSLYQQGRMSQEDFLAIYGHLRPGSYDILSPRYDQSIEKYFGSCDAGIADEAVFNLSESRLEAIDTALAQAGIQARAVDMFWFIREAIQQREHAKFVFTRSLSCVLELIAQLGERVNVSREDLAFVDVQTILSLYSCLEPQEVNTSFLSRISHHKANYRITQMLKLPVLIRKPDDIYSFYQHADEPNFVTLSCSEGHVVVEDDLHGDNLSGAIACIESADPGYDFLFSRGIAGLVTMFGGANSHMAIRCAELGIPAVIGAGEVRFVAWAQAKVLHIDASNKLVFIVK